MSQWEPIETAPRDETKFLAIWLTPTSHEPFYGIVYWLECQTPLASGWYNFTTGDGPLVIPPTRWIPLPEPPK